MYSIILIISIYWWNTFFFCLQKMETGGYADPANVVGDAGEIGFFQILPDYWRDAIEYDPSIGGEYEDCKGFEYSQKVIRAYMQRYALDKGIVDPVKMARIHNAGPKGYKKEVSIEYGNKFKVLWEQYYVTERVID